jgi:hypothetical protein
MQAVDFGNMIRMSVIKPADAKQRLSIMDLMVGSAVAAAASISGRNDAQL